MASNHLVVMAGGVGSRFWPLSSPAKPKQFVDILGCGKSLLQLTVERFKGVVPSENVWVVTSRDYADITREQLPDVPRGNILLEPARRNTAACICYASWKIKKRDPRANLVVVPSDHVIADVEAFRSAIEDAMEFSAETDAIVTIGIRPTAPATGYGYIKADLGFSSSRKKNIFRVDKFKEKPALPEAEAYIQQKNYFWNAGIFVWSVSTIINAFRVYLPSTSQIFEDMLPVYDTPQEKAVLAREFPKCENISVDYAIIEKAEEVFVYPASFGWSDLGTWSSLRVEKGPDGAGNAVEGADVQLHDTRDTVVYTKSLRRVVVQGLEGYVVAENDGDLLICRLSEEQRIKTFVGG